jgi:hypothetical protein
MTVVGPTRHRRGDCPSLPSQGAAIAGAGVIGGVMLDTPGLQWFAWTLVALLIFA